MKMLEFLDYDKHIKLKFHCLVSEMSNRITVFTNLHNCSWKMHITYRTPA